MSTLTVKELSHPAGEVIKIAAGKTLDLHSQGTTKLPVGTPIQVVSNFYASTSHVATASTSFVPMGSLYELTITPKYSNSLIVVDINIGMAHCITGTGLMHTITKGGTPMETPQYGTYMYNSDDTYLPVYLTATGVAGGTSSITYGVSFRVDGLGASSRAIHSGGGYNIKLTEIAQ